MIILHKIPQELSDLELELIVGGINSQPLPPGFAEFIARQPEAEFIARQPEAEFRIFRSW